jgi:hypothetical protein
MKGVRSNYITNLPETSREKTLRSFFVGGMDDGVHDSFFGTGEESFGGGRIR